MTPKVHGANLSVIIRSGEAVEDAICRRNGVPKEVIVERSATPHLVSLVLADVEAASGLKPGAREQKKAKALVNRYLDTVYFPAADSVGAEAD